jgi:glutamate synthase domain-containing protein 3
MVLGKLRNQRGAGMIGCLFMIAIIAAGMYAGFQFGLPRLRHSSYEERINEAIFTFRQQPAEDIQRQLIQMAQEFDIELTPAQVKVSNVGGQLKIDVTYEKRVDLKVWQTTLPFNLHRSGPY